MKLLACVLGALLLQASRGHAACSHVPNEELLEYVCEGGSLQDLQQVPAEAEKIRISGMPVHRVTEATFSRFGPSLLVLTCSNCSIGDIEDASFRHLENLQQLSLDNNQLTEVRAAWFERLASLTFLDLNYNAIERIEPDVFRNAPGLVDLRVSGNRLQCLDVAGLSRLQGLQRIFLTENPDFACPNAVKRFLKERHVDFQTDPQWSAVQQDRLDAGAPVPPAAAEPTTTPLVYRTRATATEPPATSTPEPATTAPPPPPTPPRQRPYVPEMIQPSVVDQDFAYQGPYYAPKVTQPPDNYRNIARNESSATPSSSTSSAPPPSETTIRVLAAGVGPIGNGTASTVSADSTTECPTGGAHLPAAESLLLALALAAALPAWAAV